MTVESAPVADEAPDGWPLISVVTPVYDPPIAVLTEAIESVLAQTFGGWELLLIDDGSTDPKVRETLGSYAARDGRIRVIERASNGHIVAASNDGVDAARGEFLALLDHDDTLAPHALARNVKVIAEHEDIDYIYSDEDHIDEQGRYGHPFAKPIWSPERLRSQNYCCHLSVFRTALVRAVGRFREGFDGSQDHDLILRVSERSRRIVHIPEVLYHWREVTGSAAGDAEAKPYALEAGRRAVQEHLERVGIAGAAEIGGPGHLRIHRPLPGARRISLIIPTIGSSALVWGRERVLVVEAVRSALERTRHVDIEVVVVYDEPTPAPVLDELADIAGDRLLLVPFREPFNYSRKINFGVLASSGDRVVLLNDDTQVRTDDWLEDLVAPLEEPDVGMTGAKLFFSSNTVQHAGIACSRGFYIHPWATAPAGEPGNFAGLLINREVSGVTGACAALRREVFLEVGGLTENLPEAFNDVDFSYKLRTAGYRILALAQPELFHFETLSRESKLVKDWEYDYIRARWGYPVRDDYLPAYPNLPKTKAERDHERLERLKSSADLGEWWRTTSQLMGTPVGTGR